MSDPKSKPKTTYSNIQPNIYANYDRKMSVDKRQPLTGILKKVGWEICRRISK